MNTETVAKLFGVPVANVRAQYRANSAQLAGMAKRAGAGIYNGKPASYWKAKAAEYQKRGNS